MPLSWSLFFYTYIFIYNTCVYIQPIAFGVSINPSLQSQSHWSLFNRTWQKRPRELDDRLRFKTEETTLQMQQAVLLVVIRCTSHVIPSRSSCGSTRRLRDWFTHENDSNVYFILCTSRVCHHMLCIDAFIIFFHGVFCVPRICSHSERWGAGVEYHFQEFNEPYAPS